MRRFNCCDCSCSTPVDDSEAGNLSVEDVHDMLCNNQLGIDTLWFMECILFSVWLFYSLVPGFSLYNGTVGTANPVSHYAWWAWIEFVVLMIGARMTSFHLSMPSRGNRLEYPVRRAVIKATIYMVALVIGIVSNTIHFALTIVETSFCTSTFCTDEYGFLIVFIVMLGVLVFPLQFWLLFRVYVYQQHLSIAVQVARTIFDMTPSDVPTTTNSKIDSKTPLLEVVMQNRGGKKGV